MMDELHNEMIALSTHMVHFNTPVSFFRLQEFGFYDPSMTLD